MSVSTASRALNGDPTVTQALATRAREAALRLGYQPNTAARALRGRQNIVSLLADDVGTEALAQLATALEARVRELGSNATVSSADGDPQAQLEALRTLRAMRPRALVLTGRWLTAPEAQSDIASELELYATRDGGRVVIVGPTTLPFDSVEFADFAAGVDVGRHMAATGGRSAVILAGWDIPGSFTERTRGFLHSLAAAGIRDVRTIHSRVTRDDGAAALASALKVRVPDLVLASNDRLALGALRALEEHRLRVPEDVAVSGIDNVAVAADTSPALTSVGLPFAEAGVKAAGLALSEAGTSIVRVKLTGELIVRDSTRVLRASSRGPALEGF